MIKYTFECKTDLCPIIKIKRYCQDNNPPIVVCPLCNKEMVKV